MSIEWRGAPTRIAHNCLRARPEARVARTEVGAMVIESARAATWYGYRTGTR